ncbi:MAG: hypothetical protein HQL29_03745 [Candidatus Omnitrophica bacterium]|nr:hypothetical protein [Candidatus Omnitrophota bacterium]
MKLKADNITVDNNNSLVLLSLRDEKNKNFQKIDKVQINGKWELTPQHDLVFHVLNSDYARLGLKNLIFKGEILDQKGDSFSFKVDESVNIKSKKNTTITLKGKWKLDKERHIIFKAAKGGSNYNTLTFYSEWKVSKNNEILYTYKKTALKRKDKVEQEVAFKGSWEMGDKKLTYKLSGSTLSCFDIKAELAGKILRSGDNKILFKLGSEYSYKAPAKGRPLAVRDLTLYGKWDINKHFNVIFYLDKMFQKNKVLEFGIEKMVFKNSKLGVFLATQKGKKLGVKIEFNKTFSKDIDFFVNLASTGKDLKVLGGFEFKF